MIEYENYHKHTYYSNVFTSDSTASLRDYCERIKKNGQQVLSTVEHGWQGNYFGANELCREYGIKLAIGAEAYWVKDRTTDDKSNCHIIMIAKNENGRRAINKALSEANLTGFYYRPRVDIPLLMSLPKDDVIITTACVAYWKYDDIDLITEDLSKHFGNNFYLEVQPHNNERQSELNKHILELREKIHAPIIAGIDSHFILPPDSVQRDDFIKSKGMVYEDEQNWFMDFPNAEQLYKRFADQTVLTHSQIEEAMSNTLVFREVAEYNSPVFNDEIKMPSLYPTYSQEQKNDEYLKLVWQGWDEYKSQVPEEKWSEYEDAINYETKIVCDTNTADYFIDNYHIMKKGKENGGWLTKTARGSAPSFFTNKLLGFSDIDRVSATVHMFPDRFMSTTRILQSHSLPDIDMNEAPVEPFARAQKEVLGEDHSWPMIAYGTMKKAAAWKLYAKAQDVPFEIANTISDRLQKYELAVKHADEDEKENIDVAKYIGNEYLKIYEKSKDYLGVITSWSIHPCSYLIYDGNISEEVGLVRIKDHICCLMDGHTAEVNHFLKQDHLKVSVVEAIYSMYKSIGMEPPSVNELLSMCPPTDDAWKIYEKGCCLGINQVEKEGTAARVGKYKPTNIAELTAFVAAIRPGFSSLYKQFENREHFEFGIPSLDSVIQTEQFKQSFLLYQENIMAVLNYAGIPLDECYTAIKNIAKKRAEKVLAYQEKFRSGMTERLKSEGYEDNFIQNICDTVWRTIEDAAGYSFNASHAYCVALDSLYCAWFKAHHPLKFYEQYIRIQENKGDKDKINAAKEEAEQYFSIKFLPLKFGQDNRTIHADEANNALVNTIGSIKGYGATVGKTLYECGLQNFSSFIDVLQWLDKHGIKEAKYKPLILIDYFSQYGNQRKLSSIARMWEFFKQGEAKSIKRDAISADIEPIIQRHANGKRKDGKDAASYSFPDSEAVMECLREIEQYINELNVDDLDLRTKIQNSLEILGYVDVATGKEADRRRLLVTDVIPLRGDNDIVWAYRVGTRSLGSGKTTRVSIRQNVFDKMPVKTGDIIYAAELWKNPKGYWYLQKYDLE